MLKRFLKDREISDWLSPVVVKELRQAVRSRAFFAVFVVVQISMILFVTFGMATATSSSEMDLLGSMFWTIVGAYMCVVIPLLGFNAIASEHKDGRMDLLRITHLSSRGIVRGKWLSLNIQSWLVVLSLAPYLALRYFVGSINPFDELWTLASIIYCAMLGSSITVASSAMQKKWTRLFFFCVATFSILFFSGIATSMVVSVINEPVALIAVLAIVQIAIGYCIIEAASNMLDQQCREREYYAVTTPPPLPAERSYA